MRGRRSTRAIDPNASYWRSQLADFGERLRQRRKVLGLSQPQMARKIGVNQSQISRIEYGLGVPGNYPTAKTYAECYQLDRDETQEWFRLLFGVTDRVSQPLFKRSSSTNLGSPVVRKVEKQKEELLSPDEVVNLLEDQLAAIYEAHTQGNSRLAISFVRNVSKHFHKILKREILSPHVHQALRIYGRMLYEQAIAQTEIKVAGEILKANQPLVAEMRSIARMNADGDLFGLADSILGNTYYIVKQYDNAARFLSRGLERIKDVDGRLLALRTLALSFGYLKDQTRFLKTENAILDVVNDEVSANPEMVVLAYEGLGRGYGLFKSPRAFDLFADSFTLYQTMLATQGKAPLRHVQVVRSRLEVAQLLEPRNKTFLEREGLQGIQHAQEYNYPRYVQLLNGLLKKVLD